MKPLVAIIIINYNGLEDTKECLESIQSLEYVNYKTYVLDNASPDNSGEELEQYINSLNNNRVIFLQSEENLGFTGGNNKVITLAISEGAEYIWLVNNDTTVDSKALSSLMDAMESDDQLGMVSSRIYYYGTSSWWFVGGEITKFGNVWQIKDGTAICDQNVNSPYYKTDYITGCSLLARTTMIKEIGLLNYDYFMYFEDTEWCIRAKKFNWKIGCAPKSLMWHKVSASTQKIGQDASPLKQYFQIRNHFYIINTLFPFRKRLLPYSLRFYWIFRRFLSIGIKYRTNIYQKYKSLFKAIVHAAIGKKGNTF